MVNDYDIKQIKRRFGGLLSSLHDTGFTDEYITHAIIDKPFFDMFENNDISNFTNNSIMHIVEQEFNKDVMIGFSSDEIIDYIWAGEIYITIMINYQISLKQLFIICPLEKMLGYFNPYHEMHNIKICEEILRLRSETSILKYLRNDKNLSLRQLSFLTGINQSTLAAYEKDNNLLFSSSFNNILRIKEALNVSLSCLKNRSEFIPFTSVLFSNQDFRNIFINNLFEYFNCSKEDKYIVVGDYQNEKEYRQMLKDNKMVVSLYLSLVGIISISSNRLSFKTLNDNELLCLYNKTIKELDIPDCPLTF